MRLLIVEDDDDKRRRICDAVAEMVGDVTIVEAKSLNGGLRLVSAERFGAVLLDMAMPSFDIGIDEDGGRPQAFAGRELMLHMEEAGLDVPVVVLTQYEQFGEGAESLTLDELDRSLSGDYAAYVGTIFYNAASEVWKQQLRSVLERIRVGR